MGEDLEIEVGGQRRRVSPAELAELAGSEDEVDVADLVDVASPFTHASFESIDGGYRASIPLETVIARGRIEIADDSRRLRVVDGETLCWNVKDLGRIRLTVGPEPDSVPENPPH